MESKFHTFAQPIQSIPLPERFTYPFHYTPHPLCVIAAEETQAYLKERTEWREELQTGKMFGVLVVRTPAGEVGYLAAGSPGVQCKPSALVPQPPLRTARAGAERLHVRRDERFGDRDGGRR